MHLKNAAKRRKMLRDIFKIVDHFFTSSCSSVCLFKLLREKATQTNFQCMFYLTSDTIPKKTLSKIKYSFLFPQTNLFGFCSESPDIPRIFDTQGKEILSVAGPYKEGHDLHLKCSVKGGELMICISI